MTPILPADIILAAVVAWLLIAPLIAGGADFVEGSDAD